MIIINNTIAGDRIIIGNKIMISTTMSMTQITIVKVIMTSSSTIKLITIIKTTKERWETLMTPKRSHRYSIHKINLYLWLILTVSQSKAWTIINHNSNKLEILEDPLWILHRSNIIRVCISSKCLRWQLSICKLAVKGLFKNIYLRKSSSSRWSFSNNRKSWVWNHGKETSKKWSVI